MIAAERLTKRYGRLLAVDSIDFEIPKGKVTGFLGPNGAGKTTVIRMIAGFLPPSQGSVSVDGLNVMTHSRVVRRGLGYLPEHTPLYTEMRVKEYLHFRGKLFGLPRKDRKHALSRVLEQCGLEEVRRRPIHQLSRGFRQRVGLASALLHDPPVLILDEPTVGLDPTQIQEIRSLIRKLAGGHTILLSSHILPEVEKTCDHILMIARGRIRVEGTLDAMQGRASRSSHFIVETDTTGVARLFRQLHGVSEVEELRLDDRWRRFVITPRDAQEDLREILARTLAEQEGLTRQITRVTATLEELFVRMAAEAEEDFAVRQAATEQKGGKA